MDYDILIRNGTLVDGTGAAPRRADVGVRDGRIAAVGQLEGTAKRSLDAEGQLVTPGFVDVHTTSTPRSAGTRSEARPAGTV